MKPQIFTARKRSALFLLLGVALLAASGYASRAVLGAAPSSGDHKPLVDTKTPVDTSLPDAASPAPLASFDLRVGTVTAVSEKASISAIDFGNDISLTIPNQAAPRSYSLSIPLSSDESLAVLTSGRAAIIQT